MHPASCTNIAPRKISGGGGGGGGLVFEIWTKGVVMKKLLKNRGVS